MTRWLARGALLGVATLVGIELALQIASALVSEPHGAWREAAEQRVLCVGDSHTWGAAVEREESYPGQLQRVLDERAPGRFSVLNLGLPGMNTTQVRKRVPAWLDRYEPEVLVVWVGVNNAWNSAEFELEERSGLARLDQLALHSRLYRLVRTRLHDRELESEGPVSVGLLDGQVVDMERGDPLLRSVAPDPRPAPGKDAWQRAIDDYAEIARTASAMGARTLFISYPLGLSNYGAANLAIDTATEGYGLEQVDGRAALERIPKGEADWRWALHPGPRIYREIAEALADALLQWAG